MSTVSTSPRATEDSVTPRRHSLTEGQKPGWTWMARENQPPRLYSTR